MAISNISNQSMNPIKKILTNQKFADFAQTTACAISVETTLKATGRPCFIYFDENANERSKKYAATKEFLYQSFCLGLYLSFIKPIKKQAYKVARKQLINFKPETQRKLDLYDNFQEKIDTEKNKVNKKKLEAELSQLINNNSDYHLGKGAREFGAILSTVFILGICAPLISQAILHPVLDKILPKKKSPTENTQA